MSKFLRYVNLGAAGVRRHALILFAAADQELQFRVFGAEMLLIVISGSNCFLDHRTLCPTA